MRHIIELFRKILEKYKFIEPVPLEIQNYIISSRRGVIDSVLKSIGQFSRLYSFAVSFNLLMRKAGLRMTMFQSKIVLWTCTVLLASSAAAAIIYGSVIISDKVVPVTHPEKKHKTTAGPSEAKPVTHKKKKTTHAIKFRKKTSSQKEKNHTIARKYRYSIGVQNFKSSEPALGKSMTGLTSTELKKLLNRDMIIHLGKEKSSGINYMVSGSIRKLGEKYMIICRVINVETSKVIYTAAEKVESKKDINEAGISISKKIYQKLK